MLGIESTTLTFLNAHPWLLAFVIFLARVGDVSLGTFRSIVVFRGYRLLAAIIGFFECIVWISAAGIVFSNLSEWYLILAYAAGFGTGNYVGIWLESRIAFGSELVRVISYRKNSRLTEKLRKAGFNAIELSGSSEHEQSIEVILIIEQRRRITQLLDTIRREDPDAVYTISDVKHVYSGPQSTQVPAFLNAGWHVRGKRK